MTRHMVLIGFAIISNMAIAMEQDIKVSRSLKQSTVYNVESCTHCGKAPCHVVCQLCGGAMFCDETCQTLSWDTHQPNCEKISQVFDGNLIRIYGFIDAYIKAYQNKQDKNYLYKAIKSQCVLIYRGRQDIACMKEKSARNKTSFIFATICEQQDSLLKELMENANISIDQENEISAKALDFVKDHTNDSMISPVGILDFINEYVLDEKLNITFSDEKTWLQKRQWALTKEYEQLENWKQSRALNKSNAIDNNN